MSNGPVPDPRQVPNPRPANPGRALAKITYFVDNEVETTEIGIARLRAALIPDAGVKPSGPRFLDDPDLTGGTTTDSGWRSNQGGASGKDNFSLPPASIDKELQSGERAKEVRKVEVIAQLKFSDIETFLAYLDRKSSSSGCLTYPGFSLAQFTAVSEMKDMVHEVAEAMAKLVISENRYLKELSGEERDLAIGLLVERICRPATAK